MPETAKGLPSGPVTAMEPAQAQELLDSSLSRPHEGRVYDYYLGGAANWAVDRAFAEKEIDKVPDVPWAARQNRRFLGRAVSHMVSSGIRQFVDIGSGLPTEGNVHEVVDREVGTEDAHVVYIDHDQVATAHAQLLLERAGKLHRHRPITGDLLDSEQLWKAVLSTGLIDPTRPVGLLMVAVLHFVPDDDVAHRAVSFWRNHVCSGSFLAISHVAVGPSHKNVDTLKSAMEDYKEQTTAPVVSRNREELAEFFDDWRIITPPGIVWTADWRIDGAEPETLTPERNSSRSMILAGVGVKP